MLSAINRRRVSGPECLSAKSGARGGELPNCVIVECQRESMSKVSMPQCFLLRLSKMMTSRTVCQQPCLRPVACLMGLGKPRTFTKDLFALSRLSSGPRAKSSSS